MPVIPGYLEPPAGDTLLGMWSCPEGLPDQLWPVNQLRKVSRSPTDWLTIEEHYFTDAEHGGTGCVLVSARDSAAALRGDTGWIGRDLGSFLSGDDGTFDSGLQGTDRGLQVEFFVHAREAIGTTEPVVEITHPFLWYWDAYPVNDGWKYLNRAGREQDLVRLDVSADSWKVDVRALEFRQFLAASGRSGVLQLDYTPKADLPEFERIDDEFTNEWAHFDFHALHHRSMGDRPAFARLLGRYVVTGLRNVRVPRFEERRQNLDYTTFIHDIDRHTGQPLLHTCDPHQLGTYYDQDDSRLHYLTPIYFKREVLQPYAAEPGRYRLSVTRLACLNLWGIDIAFNSVGLVEVYLGDLGSKLPADEWNHWRSYNVPPQGKMDEGRFRRDFLNQPAPSKNSIGDLRRARVSATETSQKLLGAPLWKALTGDVSAQFESLIGPLSDDSVAMAQPLLTLTKALVDAIDPAPLKAYLGSHESGEQSLRLLTRFAERLGSSHDLTSVLRELQSFRSKGGIAHLAGSGREKAAAELEISGLSNWDAFESVVTRLTTTLIGLTDLMRMALEGEDVGSSDA